MTMRLTNKACKILYEPVLWNITTACYTGVQIPDRKQFKETILDGEVWVYSSDRGVFGPSDSGVFGYAAVSTNWCGYRDPVLRSIAVLPEHRRCGVAKDLLQAVENFYRVSSFEKILLHVKSDNLAAQCLYLKSGYRVTKVLTDYYSPEGDGLEMELTL